VWKFRTGDEIASAPAAYGNRVFVGSFDENLYCLDFETGHEIWRFKTGAEIHNDNPFMIKNGVIYFTSFDNFLYAVDIETGKEIWRFRTGRYGNAGTPNIFDGKLFHAGRDGIMYCLDVQTGKELWRFVTESDNSMDQIPLIHDGVLYFGGSDGNFYALRAENGKELWRFKTSGGIFSSPVLYKNRLCFGSWDCHLYCINLTGKEIWRFQTSTLQQSYLPKAFQEFKMEVKKTFIVEEVKQNEKYTSKKGEIISLSDYNVKSDYATTSEYKQKSDYDVSFILFEDILECENIWISVLRVSSHLISTSR
jgi:outer membrane protein assembly factor BamB